MRTIKLWVGVGKVWQTFKAWLFKPSNEREAKFGGIDKADDDC